MTDLFDTHLDDNPATPSQEEALRRAMQKQWQDDLEAVSERGVIPDWIGEPRPLSKDKARLLGLLYEVGSVSWTSSPSKNNRQVTEAMGLQSTGNAKAVIDMCLREKLAATRIYRGALIVEMTQEGEYALEEYQLDVELGIL